MKSKYINIILEALNDYRNWFTDQGGDKQEINEDAEKRKLIDETIKYVEEERE